MGPVIGIAPVVAGISPRTSPSDLARDARIELKLRCVDLWRNTKLSEADLNDLQTCKRFEDEDWAQAAKEAAFRIAPKLRKLKLRRTPALRRNARSSSANCGIRRSPI